MKSTILYTDNLCIGYHKNNSEHIVHNNINVELKKGELTCVLGANGSGKSTLLRTLSAAQPAISGMIYINGTDLYKMNKRSISKNIGIVLTDKTQNGGLTVYETVALGRQPHTGFFGRLKKNDIEIIDKTIKDIGILHKKNSYMAELSDGEKQKVMIAKALVQECPIIILDEPTAFLDAISKIEIMKMLHKIATKENKSILLSTHDIEQAVTMADKLWLLKNKKITFGVPEDIIAKGEMDDLFCLENKVTFDPKRGTYIPQIKYKKTVALEHYETLLGTLCCNALKRYGIECINCQCLTCKNNIDIIRPASYNKIIILSDNKEKYTCNSFEEMIEHLI